MTDDMSLLLQPGGRPSTGASDGSGDGPKRRRPLRTFVIVLVVVVLVLAILAVVAELIARHVAETIAEKQIETSLPDGTTGQVDVTINGFSVILQALGGSLDDVDLTSHKLVVQGVPIRFTAQAADVPLKQGGITGPITARVAIDQKALNESKLLKGASGNIALGKKTFSYDSSISILGLALKYKLTAKPSVSSNGTSIVLTPTDAAISSSNSSIDVSSLLTYLKTQPPTVCIASSLPKNAKLTGVDVTPGTAVFHLRSSGLPLSESALSEKGKC